MGRTTLAGQNQLQDVARENAVDQSASHRVMAMKVSVRGDWPGVVTLRSGFAKGVARPWNESVPDAHLRVDRGSVGFLRSAWKTLSDIGAPAITSPPLPVPRMPMWRDAGFEPWLELHMYGRDLMRKPPAPNHAVVAGTEADWAVAVAIDHRAFDDLWRLGPLGLAEAREATSTSEFTVVRNDSADIVGFAIVGIGSRIGYLQRVAVDPDARGQGYGRALVRSAIRWTVEHGGTSLLLNTQPDNDRAARLYVSEGFSRIANRLSVLRREAG